MQLAPKVRSVVAQSLMGGVGLGMAAAQVFESSHFPWQVGVLAAGITGASLFYGAKSLVGQTIARGVSWAVLVPTGIYTMSVIFGRMGSAHLLPIAAAVASALALIVARPLTNTAEAKAEFDPRVLRRWFLATSTATTFIASYGALMALILSDESGHRAMTGAALAGSAALGASAFGLLRMRTWGALLSMAVTALGVLATPFLWSEIGPVPLLAGIPGWMALAGILAAKTGVAEPKKQPRVAAFDFSDVDVDAPVRVRVATSEVEEELAAAPEAKRLTA